jgi:hypothetical protein
VVLEDVLRLEVARVEDADLAGRERLAVAVDREDLVGHDRLADRAGLRQPVA